MILKPTEAERVRTIVQLYLQHESLLPVVEELSRRGWVNKRLQTRKPGKCGGKLFTRSSLYKLLTNVAYLGKVRYKDEIHEGGTRGDCRPGSRVLGYAEPGISDRRNCRPIAQGEMLRTFVKEVSRLTWERLSTLDGVPLIPRNL